MKKLRIGVFGAGRGTEIARNFLMLGCEIVAICDKNTDRRNAAAKKLGESIPCFEDFDQMLECEMDAVVLSNFFHEHTPYAIKCLEKGIHVFCECIVNGTMAAGVELIRAAEQSKAIFMLGENYPQMKFNREIKRVCDGGSLGKLLYAEGEYNHPTYGGDTDFIKRYIYFEKHWRNYLPKTYYITHSLGPVMHATGAKPVRVSAFASFAPYTDNRVAKHNADRAAIIITQNDDGSVFRITGCAGFGAHHNSYRVCGTEGQIENLRGMGGQIMLRYNEWSVPQGKEKDNLYEPQWNDKDEELIKRSGHGGADYLTARMFLECVENNKQPEFPFDVYSAVTMSSVAILAHRSVLEGGAPYDIPDFHLEESRKQYENDRSSPFWGSDGSAPTLPCCSHTDYEPTEEQMKNYRELLGG